MARETPIDTLREATQVLRNCLEQLDQARVGRLAACYIDHAADLLNDEAMMLIARKPGNSTGQDSDTTQGSDDRNLR